MPMIDPKTFTIDNIEKGSRLFFIGIGGISMFGLAQLAGDYGFVVGGSDNHPNERTEELASRGIEIFNCQDGKNIDQFSPDYVIRTAAVKDNNPEVVRCREKGIQIFDRSEFLGAMTRSHKSVINISGTHGKTTTTSMTTLMLMEAGIRPTVHIGAPVPSLDNKTVILGEGRDLLVSEACEFNRSFYEFTSTTAAITNIDHDHIDIYPTLQDVIEAFSVFIGKTKDSGNIVVTKGDKNIVKSIELAKEEFAKEGRTFPRVVTCGRAENEDADFAAKNIVFTEGHPSFDLYIYGEKAGHISLCIPGSHNIDNCLIAAACAYLNGADADSVCRALDGFTGADGRYTIKGQYKGCDVVVDYAHHPAAARATIEAASNMPHGDILVVFQPLTYYRVKVLFEDYVKTLLPCKKVLFGEVYSDREDTDYGVSSKDISDEINRRGGDAEFYSNKMDIIPRIDALVKPGDIILILGPEDIRELGDIICSKR